MDRGEILEYLEEVQGRLPQAQQILLKQRELIEIEHLIMRRVATGPIAALRVAERKRAVLIAEIDQLLEESKQTKPK
jgi:hypothetical protein